MVAALNCAHSNRSPVEDNPPEFLKHHGKKRSMTAKQLTYVSSSRIRGQQLLGGFCFTIQELPGLLIHCGFQTDPQNGYEPPVLQTPAEENGALQLQVPVVCRPAFNNTSEDHKPGKTNPVVHLFCIPLEEGLEEGPDSFPDGKHSSWINVDLASNEKWSDLLLQRVQPHGSASATRSEDILSIVLSDAIRALQFRENSVEQNIALEVWNPFV